MMSLIETGCSAAPGGQNVEPADVAARSVCHVSMMLSTGGLERLLVDFARFSKRSRFSPRFVALGGLGAPADEIGQLGCDVRSLGMPQTGRVRVVRSLARLLREGRTSIVHTHNTYAHFYGSLAAVLAGVPIVINTQHGRGCGPTWKHRWQFRMANLRTQRIVAVSEDAARLCRQEDPRAAGRVIRIWNGIDLTRFAHRGPRLGAGGPTAISVARLSREKDLPTLLQAVALVRQQWPEFRLQLVGDGHERALLERLTDELGLRACVAFLGERHDVPALLAQADFFVSSSRTEGISLTLLEAAAVGLPIVATRVGGNPEIVAEGRSGILAPAEESRALAAAIVAMCEARERWGEMGAAGREHVERHFEVRRMVDEYESLYESLLEGR